MRVGSILRLVRLSAGSTLRSFAERVGMPHATLSAIENGWLFPTAEHVNRIWGVETYWARSLQFTDYMWAQFNRERLLRQLHDPPICPLNLAAHGALAAFLREPPIPIGPDWDRMILPEHLYPAPNPSNRDVYVASALESFVRADLEEHGQLTPLMRFRLVFWRSQAWIWIPPDHIYRHPLTRPSARLSRMLNGIVPTVGHSLFTPSNLVERLATDRPGEVPDSFSALDILLLLSTEIHLDPLKPSEVKVSLVTARGDYDEITARDNRYLAPRNLVARNPVYGLEFARTEHNLPQTSPPGL